MRKLLFLFLIFTTATTGAFCQKITLDGYVFEEYNRGFLNEVKVTILDVTGIFIGETVSDIDGHFVFDGVEAGREYIAQYDKKIFKSVRDTFSTAGKKAGEKIFLKRQMERQPGYLLEVTLADKRISPEIATDGINGCRIEVFNITKNKPELVIDSAKSQAFSVTLQQANQYTMLIRKKGYFTRRMDANVNINGCYLCMDGFGTVTPGVSSNLTSAEDNKLGTLVSNIELESIDTARNIVIQNIYYPLASAELTFEARKELDKIVSLLRNNGALVVELGSHTDSRGSELSNVKLSQARAQSAVNYITSTGWVDVSRIKAKGYGESRLTNKCEDGTPCSEAEHIRNRRTELKILGFTKDPAEGLSLEEIVHREQMMQFALSTESDQQYSASGASIPQPIKPYETPKVVEKPQVKLIPHPSVIPKNSSNAPNQTASAASKINSETFNESAKPVYNKTSLPNISKENVKVNLTGVDKAFTGYKIEVFASKEPLATDDPDLKMIAFDVMSDIQIDKLKNGQFSYMVGTFLNWGETERYLEKIQSRYPKAQIVDYYNGKRVGQ